MKIPFTSSSPPSHSSKRPKELSLSDSENESSLSLQRRRGGGGRGGGGGGGGRGGGEGGSTGSRGGVANGGTVSSGFWGKGSSFSTSTSGGGSPRSIPKGMPFAGSTRTFGGASRNNIWGSNTYGSGYGPYFLAGAGGAVAGRSFGYGFWPIYWGPHYFVDDEYGPRNNRSRPGGPQAVATFGSSSIPNPSDGNTTSTPPPPPLFPTNVTPPQYALYGDNQSVSVIMPLLVSQCDAILAANSSQTPNPPNDTLLPPDLRDDWSLQYYRESSFVLSSFINNGSANSNSSTNNNATAGTWNGIPNLNPNSSAVPFIWPIETRNQSFQDCLNRTIGQSLPIVTSFALPSMRAPNLFSSSTLIVFIGVIGLNVGGGQKGLLGLRMELESAVLACLFVTVILAFFVGGV